MVKVRNIRFSIVLGCGIYRWEPPAFPCWYASDMSLSAVEFNFLRAEIDRAMTQMGIGGVDAPEYSEHTARDIVIAREALDANRNWPPPATP